jgi:hypothetical protein
MNAQSTCGATIGAVAVAVPSAEARYLRAVVGRSADVLGDGLVGVYPTGSVALGAYTPGRIDLDVMAVVAQPPPEPVLREVAARLAHEALPCPATGLEFVVYPRDVVATAGGHAGFLLDLNTGRQLNAKVSTDPAGEPRFWYVIDRAITAQSEVSLVGMPVRNVFTAPPFETLREVVVESIGTHAVELGEHGTTPCSTPVGRCGSGRGAALVSQAGRRPVGPCRGPAVFLSDRVRHCQLRRGLAARRQLPAGQVSVFLEHVLRRLTDR